MSKSIFDIELRLDINKEFYKMVYYFHHCYGTTYYRNIPYSLIEAINQYAFLKWPYRDTCINCEEFLERIGLRSDYFNRDNIYAMSLEQFLYYLEFIYNIISFSIDNNYILIKDKIVYSIVENLELIAEKINYKFIKDNDKYLLIKRDANIDCALKIITDKDISIILLEYNDFKIRNDIKEKASILKKIDIYIEKNKSLYSKIDNDSYRSFGYILNNFGINHKINDKYSNLKNNELIEWYDNAFQLALHLISMINIKQINNDRKLLEQ